MLKVFDESDLHKLSGSSRAFLLNFAEFHLLFRAEFSAADGDYGEKLPPPPLCKSKVSGEREKSG